MNPNEAWERTFNAAITGLTSRENAQDPQVIADNAFQTAKAIADKSVQYHLQLAGTVHQSMQSTLVPALQEQVGQQARPYASNR